MVKKKKPPCTPPRGSGNRKGQIQPEMNTTRDEHNQRLAPGDSSDVVLIPYELQGINGSTLVLV